MARSVSLQTIGEAARRARRVADVRPGVRARRGVLRFLGGRARVAVGLVLVLLLTSALVPPMRAQTGLLFGDAAASAAAVVQMASLVGQMAALKTEVEEQRSQMRAMVFGELAPLASKLRSVNCFLSHANGLSLGFTDCLDSGAPNPWRYEGYDGQPMLDHVSFNRPVELCVDPVAQSGEPCYHRPVTAVQVRRVGDVVRGIGRAAYTSENGVYHQSAADRHARLAGGFDDVAGSFEAADEGFERRMASQRAVVEGAMSVVEEWRGCQPVLAGGISDVNDPKPPCVTNLGAGRDAAAGTVGLVQELAAQFKLIEDAQDGNASENQLDAIDTQVGLMQARISAAAFELRAAGAEAGQQAQLQGEASQRRLQELFRLRLDCLDGRMGPPAHPFNVFHANPTGGAGGTCTGAPPP